MQQQVCIKACELILLIQSSFSHYSWKFYNSYNSPIINLSFQLSKMFKLVSFLVLQHSSIWIYYVDYIKCLFKYEKINKKKKEIIEAINQNGIISL